MSDVRLALFDFDGTLTRGDTLLPFLFCLAGPLRFLVGIVWLAPVFVAYAIGRLRNDCAKERVLRHFLRGRSVDAVQAAGEVFARHVSGKWLRSPVMAQLREHQRSGDVCVLVSASLETYLLPWARAHGFDAVLCSRLQSTDGALTGALDGSNCFGPEKVARVQAWLAASGLTPQFVTAYGDSRGDREMLQFAHAAVHVRAHDWRNQAKAGACSP